MTQDNRREIVQRITDELFLALKSRKMEERYPRGNADEMDDYIKRKNELVVNLRRIRLELEELFADND